MFRKGELYESRSEKKEAQNRTDSGWVNRVEFTVTDLLQKSLLGGGVWDLGGEPVVDLKGKQRE